MFWKFISVPFALLGLVCVASCNSPDPPSSNIWASAGGGLGYAIPGPRELPPEDTP